MKLLKPIWVKHEDKLPIFSVDIHPDGTRFATGGQGADSGRVVIWNMAPIISETAENDENIPKMLCQLDNHLACVNCVRWSFSGQHLASGGDDKLIMVWKQVKGSAGGSTVFGTGGGKVNVESWRCTATLRAHHGDVLDLAWSANDAWLASCSIDNTVIVWNALKLPEQIAVLGGHTGLVKGVAWDPVGKYLSSQSEDKTLRIWRTVDWKEERVLKEPFQNCSGTTHVLRLCWSPDGQYLVSAHARNGPGPTAQIIERKGWVTNRDFVGHRKPVTCARFSQVLLRQDGMKSSQYSCCCALGSRDQSLSVWLTSLKRPLVVVQHVFTNSVLDVAWSSNGRQLMACSLDGTVACIEFDDGELGQAFTHEEKVAVHEKKYGKSLLSSNSANWSRVSETPEMLLWQEENNEKERNEGAKKTLGEDKAVIASPIKGPINKQIEVRTADGRRRITPMFIPPTPDAGDATSQSNISTASQPTFFSSESKSRIVVERREDIVEPNVARAASKTVVVNGHGPSKGGASAAVANDTAATSAKENQEKPVCNSERTPFAPVTFGGKRRAEKEKEISGPGRPSNSSSNQLAATTNLAVSKRPRLGNMVAERPQVASLQDTGPLSAKPDAPCFVLPALRIAKSATEQVNLSNKRQRCWVDVENNVLNSAHGALSRVRVVTAPGEYGKPNKVEWEAVLGSPASGVAGSSRFVVVTCDDATLHVLDMEKGQYHWPAFVLRSPASRLALNSKNQLMVVTACGHLNIWDLEKKKAVLRNESMASVIYSDSGSSVAVLSCSLSENGTPMVSLSTGKAFMFNLELGCWMLMGNSRDPISCNSIHQSFLGVPVANTTLLPLACLQSDIRSCGPGGYSRAAVAGSTNSAVGPACSLAFLDRQLAACRALHSPTEYRHWLLVTVRFLMHYDLEKRLRDICDSLLGPTYKGASESQSWDTLILGMSKHSLLQEVLNLLATNVRWQRLFVEYSEQLRTEDEPVTRKAES